MTKTRKVLVAAVLLVAQAAPAAEDTVALRQGEGRQLVESRCIMCHSLDYIQMNSPFLDRKGWEASVNKMIKVMGAPMSDAEARAIVDYLAAQYGK